MMKLKFLFAALLTVFAFTNLEAKMDSSKPTVLSKKKKEALIQAGDNARDQGYEYHLKKQDIKAVAAYKIAKAHYEQAGEQRDVERMNDLIENPAAYDLDIEARMGLKG